MRRCNGFTINLTMANCYMFFFERSIVKHMNNAGGFYVRYIDDVLFAANWPCRHLQKQMDRWNKLDANIKLNVQFGCSINFLDLYMENVNAELFTKVYHKPFYEPYFLPFNSIHSIHMKRNIPYEMLLRRIKYCSTSQTYLDEREQLRMSLLLNKYPGDFINKKFGRLLIKFNVKQPLEETNYHEIRNIIIHASVKKEQIPIDFHRSLFIYFTYCTKMKHFPSKFHAL